MPEAPTTPDPLAERVREYVTATGEGDERNAAAALTDARTLVENWIGSASIPDTAKDRAIVEVAAELFYRKSARGGVLDVAGADLQPFRMARDPMKAAYPILKQFIPGGLA